MIRRIIGFILGGLTIWLLLNITTAMSVDEQPKYLASIVIGLIVIAIWPWVMGIFLVRRAKDRRQEEIDKEVAEQLAAQQRGS